MKVKKPPMPLGQKIFYGLSFLFLLYAFMYLGTKNFNAPKQKLSDSESFAKEYGISKDNLFAYQSAKEIQEIMNTGSGIIFFAFPENEWSASYANILNIAGKEANMKTIYYYNFKNDRSLNNHYYNNIVSKLEAYLPVMDTHVYNLCAPSMILVKNGAVLYYDDETSYMRGNITVNNYWSQDKIAVKEETLRKNIILYLGA